MGFILHSAGGPSRLRIEITTDKSGRAEALQLRCDAPAMASVSVGLRQPLDIPPGLFAEDGPGVTRLKSLADIRREVAAAASQAGEDLESRWRDFVQGVSSTQVVLGTDGEFAGARVFPAGAAFAYGRADFNLCACLSQDGSAEVLFKGTIEVAAECQAQLGAAGQATVTIAWRIVLDAQADVPKLELHLPSLGIRGPSLRFPSFDWQPGWTLDAFDPGLDLPQLPDLPLKVEPNEVSFTASFATGTNQLTARLRVSDVTISAPVGRGIVIGTLDVHLDGGQVTVSPFQAALEPFTWVASPKRLPPPLDNLVLHAEENTLHLTFAVSGGVIACIGCYETTLSVYPATQPSKRLKAELTLPFKNGRFEDSVSIGGTIHARAVRVLEPNIQNLASLIQQLPSMGGMGLRFRMQGPDLPDADALIEVLAAILSAIARGAAGLAEVVRAVLEKVFRLLRSAAQMLGQLEMLVIVDEKTFALQQVIVSLTKSNTTEPFRKEAAGSELTAPGSAELALLIDLRDGARDAYAVVTLTDDQLSTLSLGTDLWFSSASLERPAGQLPAPGSNAPPQKLVSVKFATKDPSAGVRRLSLVPLGVRNGQPAFLRALKTPLPPLNGAAIGYTGYEFEPIDQQVKVTAEFGKLKNRLLPFLASPAAKGQSGVALSLKQYIEIDHSGTTASLEEGRFTTDLSAKLHLLDSTIQSQLKLELDALKMTAGLSGGLVRISVPKDQETKEFFSLFGMNVELSQDTEQFILDLQGSDPRLYLADGVKARLVFKALGTDINGKHLAFDISHFTVHGGGLDLDAELAQPYRMRLKGLGTEFTFAKANIKVRNGQAESFLLKANGKLPPDLLGDVDVNLELDFGVKSDGAMGLLDGRLNLASDNALVRSERTHFDFLLQSIGMRVFESGGDLHFCAFITGSATFKPTVSELADGMLSKLAGVELRFTDLPVSGDSDVIRRELRKLNLSFVVALDEPKRASLFQMFFFEVRSIGFEPGCSMWDDRPFALVIGGQVRFADTGDVVRAECDFHRLYMAPGKGTILSRIKCEGLGVALRLGSAIEIDGKVVAVDGTMQRSLESLKPEPRLQANGFMGQGRVAIQGLPPMAASFGFVEVTKPGWSSPRRAWFVFLEAQHISYHFQLGPVPFYLREVGLGLGYHFTYVGIKAIDEALDLPAVIKELDKIAGTALEPAKYETWDISDQADYTLVARGMFSMSSASPPQQPLTWNKEQEAELPNLMLLNAVLAMRKSTFMMTANAWLGYSYYDWDEARQSGANRLAGKQALTGYVILAGERSEFLARLVSNPGAEVGSRLALPDTFRSALKDVQYDATLYMRPGLLHFELGWPNRIRWAKNIAGVNITVAGGAIFRVHDGALLAGLNLEGQISCELSGRLDAGVVGISVEASLNASLVARIIGYLDSRRAASSLYYSLFALQVQLRFRVSAWLQIKKAMFKFTIRTSFSFSLQIDVMAELAIQGDMRMGTRMRATIAVSVFGRSLGLSVGLAANPGLVDSAAARVGRFMNLGLIQDTPSSVASIGTQDAANLEAAQVGEDRRKAREMAEWANSGSATLAKVPHEEAVPKELVRKLGRPDGKIAATQFTVVLTYPKVAPQGLEKDVAPSEWRYLTFVPRDDVDGSASSFYAARRREDVALNDNTIPDHCIELRNLPTSLNSKTLYHYKDKAWHPFHLKAGQLEIETFVNWAAEMSYTESNKEDTGNYQPKADNRTASLTELFFACFRTEVEEHGEVGPDKPYYEPKRQPPLESGAALAASDQDRFNRQERGYLGAIMQDPADRRCHEARDFLLHKFASDLFDLAGDGRVPDTVHAAHLGLTLLVPRELADALEKDGFEAVVRKRVDQYGSSGYEHVPSVACRVFNPPDSQFAVGRPRFTGTGIVIQDGVAKLQWTLRWPGETTLAAAEDYVKHYRVVRRINVDGVDHESPAVTVTCADEVDYVYVREKDEWTRVLHRSPYRYTDDFSDLPVALRSRIFRGGKQAVIRYDVTPVCISDTDGLVCSDFIAVHAGTIHVPRLKLATATLEVDPRESATVPGTVERFVLGMRVEADETDLDSPAQEFPPRDMTLEWRLFARGEDILPAGQYGADAQSKRPLAALVGAGLEELPGDELVKIPAKKGADWPVLVIEPGDARIEKFVNLIRDTAAPRAWTFFAQLVLLDEKDEKDEKGESVVLARSKRLPVQTGIRVASADGGAPKSPMQVPALEYVRMPFAAERADVLAPVAAGDMIAVPGRAALPEPVLEGGGDLQVTRNVHPEFGAVSSLSWSLKPHGVGRRDAARYRLRSGFDVYSLSLDAGIDPRLRDSWVAARRQTAVRLLNPDQLCVTPAEVGDPANWKMRYPSDAKRRLSNGAWYSDAESFIDWPAFPVRRHPLLEPASELIQALLGRGNPDVIELRMRSESQGSEDELQPRNAVKWVFGLDPEYGSKCELKRNDDDRCWKLEGSGNHADPFYLSGGSTEGLRSALRALRAEPEGSDVASHTWDRAQRSGWVLELRPRCEKDGQRYDLLSPASERVPMAYERDLHPVIEHVLALMRRPDDTRAALFEVDRRPAPVVKADGLGEFIAETGDAADPYGWAALDRLGLGVTVRLFDTHDDRFVRPDDFRRQLRAAIKSAREDYPEFKEYLFVECLLQPGAMTQRVDFTHLPDATGRFSSSEQERVDDMALAMARISVRPRIEKKLSYGVIAHDVSDMDSTEDNVYDATSEQADVVFDSDGMQRSLKGRKLRDILNAKGAPVPRHIYWRDVKELDADTALHGKPGADGPNEPEAFGQFGTWGGWKDDEDFRQSLKRFLWTARNAMKVEAELAILEEEAEPFAKALADFVPRWLHWNRRYFEYSAVPRPPKGSADVGPPEESPIPSAIGAVEQMEPVLAAPNPARRISVNIPEPDGYAHRRAFAVLPQWRYEAILDAHGWSTGVSLQDLPQAPPFAVANIERTAPVLPQAVKSLGRLGDKNWWTKNGVYHEQLANQTDEKLREDGYVRAGSVPGNALAVAFPHHPEQLLDESNVAVGRSLSRSGLQWNFALRAADAQWTGPYRKTAPGELIAWLNPDELKRDEGIDAVLGLDSETFAQSRVKVARYLPHWYRHTVQATSAAGTVVAETTAAYLADAGAVLAVPSGEAVTVKEHHPWRPYLEGTASLAAVAESVAESKEPAFAGYKVVIPAIRYTDTTDAVTARLWADTISRLPDPEVAYDLEFVAAPTNLRPQRVVKPLARIVRSASTVPERRALRAMVTTTDWSVRCVLAEADGQAPTVTVSISPLSLAVPIGIGDAAAKTMGIDDYVTGEKARVPGGWSDDWLAWFVGKFVEGGRPDLARELWASMATEGVGLPASPGSALAVFPQYLLKSVVLTKPATEDEATVLAATINQWIGQLADDKRPLIQALGKVYAAVFADVRALAWPYTGQQHTESLPWIEGLPVPSDPVEVATEPDSMPRHLVPELMTPAEYEAAETRATDAGDTDGVAWLRELWREQKARAWDRGRLQVRATRGDAVPLELPLIDLP